MQLICFNICEFNEQGNLLHMSLNTLSPYYYVTVFHQDFHGTQIRTNIFSYCFQALKLKS